MMSVIVRTTAKALMMFILTYGMYVIANGHITPGGGFQGGTIIASAIILGLLAYGKSASEFFEETRLGFAENIGSITYITIAFFGVLVGGEFLQNDGVFGLGDVGKLFSAGFMPPLNAAIGTKVAAGMGTIAILFISLIWNDDHVG
ncbi:MAG: MnhB domain-containing protein [Candidatus Micrarchaeota archaeon]